MSNEITNNPFAVQNIEPVKETKSDPFSTDLLSDIENVLSEPNDAEQSKSSPPPVAPEGVAGNVANTVAAGQVPAAKVVQENLGPQKEVLSATAITSNADQEASSQAQGHQAIVNPNPLSIAPKDPQQEAINQRDAHNNPNELQVHARAVAENVAVAVTEPAMISPGDVLGRQPGDPNSVIDMPKDLIATDLNPTQFPRGVTDEQLANMGFQRVDLTAPEVPKPQPGGNKPRDLPPQAIEQTLEPLRRTISEATQAELAAGADAVARNATVILPAKQEGDKAVTISAKTLAELQTGRRAVNERG